MLVAIDVVGLSFIVVFSDGRSDSMSLRLPSVGLRDTDDAARKPDSDVDTVVAADTDAVDAAVAITVECLPDANEDGNRDWLEPMDEWVVDDDDFDTKFNCLDVDGVTGAPAPLDDDVDIDCGGINRLLCFSRIFSPQIGSKCFSFHGSNFVFSFSASERNFN